MKDQQEKQPRNFAESGRASPISVAFFLVPGFSMHGLAGAIDALRLANTSLRFKAFDWRVVAETVLSVPTSCGVTVQADTLLADERRRAFLQDRPALALICADQNVEVFTCRSAEAWLRECRLRSIDVGAIGAGTYVLAKAGVLESNLCTIHWDKLPGFSERYMFANVDASIYQIDHNTWTCGGGVASFHMMLQFVKRYFGEEAISSICDQALVDRVRSADERQRLPFAQKYGLLPKLLRELIRQMELNLSDPLSLDELAGAVRCSRRQVERLFRSEMGSSPAKYYQKLRLERAEQLVMQTSMSIIDIAILCGFVSTSHFSRCFREVYGLTPRSARQACRPGYRPGLPDIPQAAAPARLLGMSSGPSYPGEATILE